MKYIWMFGENLGKTANNNSYYFWKYIVNCYDEIDAYIVLQKTPAMKKLYTAMSKKEKRLVVWRNSLRHAKLYFKADMLFVTLSFRDVQPDRIGKKSYQPKPTQPLIYLQHGILGIKALDYKSMYANNSMLRWIYYNPKIPDMLKSVNGFKDYQLYNGIYHPRHMELVKRFRNAQPHDGTRLLWFITWREYFGDNIGTQRFLNKIKAVLSRRELKEYLTSSKSQLTICLHQNFKDKQVMIINEALQDCPAIRLLQGRQVDVMQEIVDNDVLITDYSSLGFDFTILEKPVILYQPDRNEYLKRRKLYCAYEELEDASLSQASELIQCIINKTYKVNPFFEQRLSPLKDLDGIASGKYIDRMYQYFLNLQKNSIAIWGYDFTGIGGTVFATNALAEGLLEKGYLVRFFTMKRMAAGNIPAGAPIHAMYTTYQKGLIDKLKTGLVRCKRFYRYLTCDPAMDAMRPICGIGTTYWMKRIHANTVISTRESLHFFLKEAQSPFIKNKIYMFHTAAELVDDLFPGAMKALDQLNLENAVFVTEKNRENLKNKVGFEHYQNHCVLGNALDSTRSINRDEVTAVEEKDVYRVAYLLRISQERKSDIQNLYNFARYLKDNNISNIVVDVYGNGDYLEEFLSTVDTEELDKYISYNGTTRSVKATLRRYDAVVDFSTNQSFGMTYIEAILNGKMVFCYRNEGSSEVLHDIPECYFETAQELTEKIYGLPQITQETLQGYYDIIWNKYSRDTVSRKFIECFLRKGEGKKDDSSSETASVSI